MTIGISLKLQLASAGLAVARISAGCAMMEPKSARFVAPTLGSTWIVAHHDSGSFGTRDAQVPTTRAGADVAGEQVVTIETPGSALASKTIER